MKKKLKFIYVFIVFTTLITSCQSSTYEDISAEAVTQNITYQKNVKPIVNSNCIECHYSNRQYPNLESYQEVKEAVSTGNVLCRIDDQSCGSVMPPTGKLQTTQINIIKKWIVDGYQN